MIFSFLVLSCSKDKEIVYAPSKKVDAFIIYKEGMEAFEVNDFFYASKKFTEAELNFKNIDLAEIFITSQAKISEGEGPENAFRLSENKIVSVLCSIAEGKKCNRSWKILPEVGTDPDYPDLSIRDADVMREISDK